MNQETALQYLRHMMFALQKYRSNTKEAYGHLPEYSDEIMGQMWPWIFGNKCPLNQLSKALDRNYVTGQEFYNFMFILERFMPEVKLLGEVVRKIEFPMPTLSLIKDLGSDQISL